MKKIVFISVLASFLLFGCGYKDVQVQYLKTQQKLAELQIEKSKPLVDITTSDGNKIIVRNPYKDNYSVQRPSTHPAIEAVKSVTGLANSRLASYLGIGYIGKEILDSATGDTIGSYNSGSEISSNIGDGTMNLDRSYVETNDIDTKEAGQNLVEGNSDSSSVYKNESGGDLVEGEGSVNNSDNSDNSDSSRTDNSMVDNSDRSSDSSRTDNSRTDNSMDDDSTINN